MRYAMICYDIHYDYSSHNDTNFTVRRFLEKNNEFVNGKLVPTCQHSMSKIVVKLFVLNRFHCNILTIFFYNFTVRRLLESGVSPDSTNEDGLTALHQVN